MTTFPTPPPDTTLTLSIDQIDSQVCAILKEKYDGDIPRTFEDLMEMPGIGPKMVRFGWCLSHFRSGSLNALC